MVILFFNSYEIYEEALLGETIPFCTVAIVADPAMKKDTIIRIEIIGAKGRHFTCFDLSAPYVYNYEEGNSVEACIHAFYIVWHSTAHV